MENDIGGVVSELDIARAEFTTLDKERIANEDILETGEKAEKQEEKSTEDTFKNLKSDREDLRVQSNDSSKYKRLNAEVQGAIVRTQQEHIAAAEIISKEIENLTESLELERKERQLLQMKRDGIIKEANEYVSDFNTFAAKKTYEINQGKALFQLKSEEGRNIQKKLKEVEAEVKLKQKEV